MKRFLKILFRPDNLFATIWVFLFLRILGFIAINIEVFDPFSKAFEDFQYTDLYFNRFLQDDQNFNDDIILINIGRDRYTIAEQIKKLEEFEPAVIALPTVFVGDRGALGDSALLSVFNSFDNIIVAEHLEYNSKEEAFVDKIQSNEKFGKLQTGFDNLIGESNGTVRSWNPRLEFDGEMESSFALKIIERVQPSKAQALIDRNTEEEIINYIGHANSCFLTFDEDEAIFPSNDMEVIKGKIVILGYLGSPMNSAFDLEDRHFTPMNPEMAGRSIPDMNGAVIHANILAMIIEGDYIDNLEEWKVNVLAFLICYLHMALFISISLKVETWFEPIIKLIALVSSIFIFYVIFMMFSKYHLKIDSGLIVLVVLVSGDLLDFYESIAQTFSKWFGFKSILLENEL